MGALGSASDSHFYVDFSVEIILNYIKIAIKYGLGNASSYVGYVGIILLIIFESVALLIHIFMLILALKLFYITLQSLFSQA